ncbi:SIMPL domain-containing protein [Capnocytophaga sputigena]|uniref:SIMPL domain-containing protein n=2 Tax=Capnocytophaga sputigena TaxID=1019 RepID=A0A250F2K2_CAPSP|nr:SIMPL domain-containing protein [Capnocytophaga sputigena]ATA69450.1 SIMPL domain-containing protein [Capnocytophaga sputigena]ATA78227.1 SIMPL domain-containing protein [Capnocytophaga sputigena]VEI52487.1 26 kDa periplasmic immunogenic protein precursor [Capnocytophaga sputigena]
MKHYFVLFSLISTMAIAQNQTPTVEVVGEGIVYATPDMVNISISIEKEGLDLKNLRQKNGEAVAQVLQLLSKELPMENFQTSYVSLYKDDYNKLNKYRVVQNINIKLEDISKYDNLMNAIFDAGVNRIDGISFGVKNKEKLLQEARVAAIDDARKKALLYAVSLDQNIGKAIKIKEVNSHFNDIQPVERMSKMSLGSPANGSDNTLAVGKIAIEAQVNVAFELLK